MCDNEYLMRLIKSQDNELALELIDTGDIDPNFKSKYSRSPLHYAIAKENLEVASYLIEKDLYLESVDSAKRTPLDYAVYYDSIKILTKLIEKGVDLEPLDKDKMSPIHWAAFRGHEDIFNLLVQYKLNINLQDKEGMTPLHYAVLKHRENIVRLLIQHEASLDVQDKDGMPPGFFCLPSDRSELLDVLINAGAKLNIQDKDGMTLLHYAASLCNIRFIKFLLSHGADNYQMNNKDQTPSEVFIEYNISRLDLESTTILANELFNPRVKNAYLEAGESSFESNSDLDEKEILNPSLEDFDESMQILESTGDINITHSSNSTGLFLISDETDREGVFDNQFQGSELGFS